MAIPSDEPSQKTALELKGRSMTLTSLRPLRVEIDDILAELDAKIAQAPAMFRNAAVVLDMEALDADQAARFDLRGLVDALRQRWCIPVAVAGEASLWAERAGDAELGILSPGGGQEPKRAKAAKPAKDIETPGGRTLLVRQPVRSGQQVYAPGGDLVVLSSVSPGAEVLADGNIHIYGTLAGRALAGVRGDTEARIFCQSLKAELVSIAGSYQISEQLEDAGAAGAVQIRLDGGALCIEPL